MKYLYKYSISVGRVRVQLAIFYLDLLTSRNLLIMLKSQNFFTHWVDWYVSLLIFPV